jgi:hypothetical protein
MLPLMASKDPYQKRLGSLDTEIMWDRSPRAAKMPSVKNTKDEIAR